MKTLKRVELPKQKKRVAVQVNSAISTLSSKTQRSDRSHESRAYRCRHIRGPAGRSIHHLIYAVQRCMLDGIICRSLNIKEGAHETQLVAVVLKYVPCV